MGKEEHSSGPTHDGCGPWFHRLLRFFLRSEERAEVFNIGLTYGAVGG
jgi:hypothetical protein